ncbi:MAG: thioredoxin family protein [Acidimicrobiales bacterium]
MTPLADGISVFVQMACPTCETIGPVVDEIARRLEADGVPVRYVSQDGPYRDGAVEVVEDRDLRLSFLAEIEAVPTLVVVENGAESARVVGWERTAWEAAVGLDGLGDGIVGHRPGCGSLSVDPTRVAGLEARFGNRITSRRIEIGAAEDPVEAAFERGWTDGLPVVVPTAERVAAMLAGTTRAADEVVAVVPPDLVECSVEKVAVNAVMAGCRPEYLPVVLTALEAVCTEEFNMHGLLATTMPNGPVFVVNGPLAERIGMNSGAGVLGPGNRANSTIGRAVQLVIRNVGGGRPGEIDMSTHGSPAKYGLCFAEAEATSPWEPLSVDRGFESGVSTVTAFGGEAPRVIADQLSRDAESLTRSLAACIKAAVHPKVGLVLDALLVVSPEHAARFAAAGWSRQRLTHELTTLLVMDGDDMIRGAGGIAEGMADTFAGQPVPKLRPGGLLITHAGGTAGLFSALIPSWGSGPGGTQFVTKEIRP